MDTSWKELQVARHTALRSATGCHIMNDPDHLHTETKVIQVRPHCEMLSKQFLLATQKPDHSNRIDLNAPATGRQMNETLQSKFGAEIKKLFLS